MGGISNGATVVTGKGFKEFEVRIVDWTTMGGWTEKFVYISVE